MLLRSLKLVAVAATTLLSAVSHARASFKIVIDVNLINSSEADSIHSNVSAWSGTDGIWVYKDSTSLSNTQWNNLISDLNGSSTLISEDAYVADQTDPFNTSSWSFLTGTLSQSVTGAFVYIGDDSGLNEWPWANTIHNYDVLTASSTYDEFTCAKNRVSSTPLIVHTRDYIDNNPDYRKTYIGYALANSYVAGATLEFNPWTYNTPGNSSSGMPSGNAVDSLDMIAFIHDTIGASKDCYLLFAPQVPETQYANSVEDTFNYIAAKVSALGYTDPANGSQSLLHSSKLHIVLAAYGRTDVGFLTGDSSTGYVNSVLDAKAVMVAYRTYGSY